MIELAPEFNEFRKCWETLPRTAHPLIPAKRDITPARMGEMLHYIGIGEMRGHEDMQVLFYGAGIERVSGIKVTGKNYYDLLPSAFVKPLSVFHAYILGTPCGAFVSDVIATPSGARYEYQSLQYPLADDHGEAKYLLVYGRARIPYDDNSERESASFHRDSIKDMHYIDLGAGAPSACIENFIFHR
ncbi:hypothetical protein [Kordiimonas sp.]|uniref:hypothetical protein n=1 Tax=Kordiimonas sp. TaxID=1970157 RepID=UPI003A8D5AEA